ncbi:MAG: addiction module protein [bacterium]
MNWKSIIIWRNIKNMNTVLDIGRLSHTEKLRAMEELWDDLSRSQEEYPSSDWHGDVLRAREEALSAGRDAFVPWEEAKAILRASTK